MSNWLAIATVTNTLSRLLLGAATQAVPGASVSTDRPEVKTGRRPMDAAINVYLYQVSPNAAWRNDDLPTRRSDGSLIRHPQVALDLHYLLTFYGNDKQLEPQRLMGAAVSALHARPVLTREMVEAAIGAAAAQNPYLAASDLAEQIEKVRFVPLPLNLEELSKLWSVFFQTPYALSVAYRASVVLIEGDGTPRKALPVEKPLVHTILLRRPFIERVLSVDGDYQPILAGSTLVIRGQRLQGDVTRLMLDGEIVALKHDDVTQTEIKLPLTAPPVPGGRLRAGLHSIQVDHPILMGDPPIEHIGFTSNLASFVLHPSITVATSNVTCQVVEGANLCSADVSVTFDPPVDLKQKVYLLLNAFEPAPGQPARDWRLRMTLVKPTPTATITNTASIHLDELAAGEYFVSAEVDGAQSPLHKVTIS